MKLVRVALFAAALVAAAVALLTPVSGEVGSSRIVFLIEIDGAIGPATARQVKEGLATAPGQLVLNGFGDETAAVSFEQIDLFEQLRQQGDGDSLGRTHLRSMAESMIILRRVSHEHHRRDDSSSPRLFLR